jgi:hypothetical protein
MFWKAKGFAPDAVVQVARRELALESAIAKLGTTLSTSARIKPKSACCSS